ncbi:MAG: hypothetical protein AAF589_07560, partial [Planctomycetota bacterium]
MAIKVLCNACGFKLEIPEEFAGKKAKCGNCGELFRVPGPPPSGVTPPSRPLARATTDEIVAELRARGCSGLLALVDLQQYSMNSLSDLLDSGEHLSSGLSISTTEPLSTDDQERLLSVIADGVKRIAD